MTSSTEIKFFNVLDGINVDNVLGKVINIETEQELKDKYSVILADEGFTGKVEYRFTGAGEYDAWGWDSGRGEAQEIAITNINVILETEKEFIQNQEESF